MLSVSLPISRHRSLHARPCRGRKSCRELHGREAPDTAPSRSAVRADALCKPRKTRETAFETCRRSGSRRDRPGPSRPSTCGSPRRASRSAATRNRWCTASAPAFEECGTRRLEVTGGTRRESHHLLAPLDVPPPHNLLPVTCLRTTASAIFARASIATTPRRRAAREVEPSAARPARAVRHATQRSGIRRLLW